MTYKPPKELLQESGAYSFDINGARLYASATQFTDGEEVSFRVDSSQRLPNAEEIDAIRKAFWDNGNDMVFQLKHSYLTDVVNLRSLHYLKTN